MNVLVGTDRTRYHSVVADDISRLSPRLSLVSLLKRLVIPPFPFAALSSALKSLFHSLVSDSVDDAQLQTLKGTMLVRG